MMSDTWNYKWLFERLSVTGSIDDPERGAFAIIEASGVDGNVMDVYGETPDHAEQIAREIVDALFNFIQSEEKR